MHTHMLDAIRNGCVDRAWNERRKSVLVRTHAINFHGILEQLHWRLTSMMDAEPLSSSRPGFLPGMVLMCVCVCVAYMWH